MGVPILVLAVLAAAAAVLQRRRIREYIDGSRLDDDMIRSIEERGTLELDDPTDMDEVREEEERFWSETWDVPDDE